MIDDFILIDHLLGSDRCRGFISSDHHWFPLIDCWSSGFVCSCSMKNSSHPSVNWGWTRITCAVCEWQATHHSEWDWTPLDSGDGSLVASTCWVLRAQHNWCNVRHFSIWVSDSRSAPMLAIVNTHPSALTEPLLFLPAQPPIIEKNGAQKRTALIMGRPVISPRDAKSHSGWWRSCQQHRSKSGNNRGN